MYFVLPLLFIPLPLLVTSQSYKATFTRYDGCNTKTNAGGFYPVPGYAALISQNAFSVGPGEGAEPACKTCWRSPALMIHIEIARYRTLACSDMLGMALGDVNPDGVSW